MSKPQKWHEVYRGDEEKNVFVGKDGTSGLIRAKDKEGKRFEWRSTDALARESGLSKKRVEEILDHWCKKGVVRQHSKDPEKWGYWEIVGAPKDDPDVVAEDHKQRVDKQLVNSGLKPAVKPTTKPDGKGTAPSLPGGQGTINTPAPAKTLPKKIHVAAPPAPAKTLPNAAPPVPATPSRADLGTLTVMSDEAYFKMKLFQPLEFPPAYFQF